MRIGDSVLVHGYVDEIRKDTVIIRNNGGYFGTVPSEITLEIITCQDCKHAILSSDGLCKYCYKWTDDEGNLIELYVQDCFYCGFAERD